MRVERPCTKKVLEAFRAPATWKLEPIEDDAFEINPFEKVARPAVWSVPLVDTLPLPPAELSTKKTPFWNVVVLLPKISEALVRMEDDAVAGLMLSPPTER